MLRRKLLIMLAVLTTLMLATALTSVLLMKGVLGDLEDISSEVSHGTAASSKLVESLALIETEFLHWSQNATVNGDRLRESYEEFENNIIGLQERGAIDTDGQAVYYRVSSSLSDLERSVQIVLMESSGNQFVNHDVVFESLDQMRQAIFGFSAYAFERMMIGQQQVTSGFRLMAISLSVISVVLINVSILLLIRSAIYVLKPVEQLLEASRHLAREEYHYRVEVGPRDEFAELADGFNSLAEHLEANEQRKIETLHQVARTLNHELNNAIAIIELQLRLVTKSSGYNQESGKQLELIHETLHQMNGTVTSLTQVRQVVLTDYIKGVKMLDLKRSTQVATPTVQDFGDQDKVAAQ